jgi:hypothetical protein
VENHSLTAQVETSKGVENMDDDDEFDAHYLQHGKERMSSGPEVRVVLKRMHECVRISRGWKYSELGRWSLLNRQVRIHIYLVHFWWWQINPDGPGAVLSLSTARCSVRYRRHNDFLTEKLFQLCEGPLSQR